MTAAELLRHVQSQGFQLEVRDGESLAVHPASKLPPNLAVELRCHKVEILNLLNPCRGWQSVPPADLPLVALKPTPTLVHRELVIAYQLRQCANQDLRRWLISRRCTYIDMGARAWEGRLATYAATRDAACWQLNRNEAAVWDLLEGIELCNALKSTRRGSR